MINNQLDIERGQFAEEEFDIILTKIKSKKTTGLNKIPPEIDKEIWWYFFDYVTMSMNKLL